MAREQIGTVIIVKKRVYPIDPKADIDDPQITSVIVGPGKYPVYRDGISIYWQMTGVLNLWNSRIGDGAYSLADGEMHSDDDVVFYSKRFGPDEFAELRRHPDVAQRLIFNITAPDVQ
jgi:hypothetical protein